MKFHNNSAALLTIIGLVGLSRTGQAFVPASSSTTHPSSSSLLALPSVHKDSDDDGSATASTATSCRQLLTKSLVASSTMAILDTFQSTPPAFAADFTPGGTLVDRQVGITVGNSEASPSRKVDNANVLFFQDYYFKFGTAAPWLEPDSTDFPKTMPFTRIQQRYDALKKYQPRIREGMAKIQSLSSSDDTTIPDPVTQDVYYLRPMGLLANNMLASENTGSTNELFLARWYINELYLLLKDAHDASTPEQAAASVAAAQKAANSYLTMMNRVITSKVGDKFEYIK